jgi:DNA-binding MarR family transcriptional regulator
VAPRRGPEDPGPDQVLERLDAIDRLLEHRVRLAITVLLARYDRLSFSRLKELTGESDGSLGAHLRRLEEKGYVAVKKEFVDRKPVSWYRLTTTGRKALAAHLDALGGLIDRAEK